MEVWVELALPGPRRRGGGRRRARRTGAEAQVGGAETSPALALADGGTGGGEGVTRRPGTTPVAAPMSPRQAL